MVDNLQIENEFSYEVLTFPVVCEKKYATISTLQIKYIYWAMNMKNEIFFETSE